MIIIKYKNKPTITQMQITDYINGPEVEYYPMWVPKFYQRARKKFIEWLPIRKRKTAKIQIPSAKIISLEAYYPNKPVIYVPKAPYLRRFISIPQAIYSDYAEGIIPKIEWDMMQALPKYTGFFNHLFEFNNLEYFDDLQEELESTGVNFKGMFLYDVIALELFRRQLGFHDFTGPTKLSHFLQEHPLSGIVHDEYYFPTAADVSYILNLIPHEKISQFYYSLVREAIELGIIDPKILIWDGQFIRTNSNNYFKDKEAKKAKRYSDPDAGFCTHNGKKKGVGYEASNLYAYCGSWDRLLPVYFDLVPGNRNENPVFRETVEHFLNLNIGKGWMFIILDTGAYSLESLDFCIENGLYPLIRAKKGLKNQPTKELKKRYYFNTDYIPEGWSDEELLMIYKIRPAIEAGQASNNTYYNSKRLNTRGMKMGKISRTLNYVLDLIRAITATKMGRTDLLCKVSAFSSTRRHMGRKAWVKMALQSNYKILFKPGLNARQKAFWDRRERLEKERAEKKKNIKS